MPNIKSTIKTPDFAVITCYGEKKVWLNRKKAEHFYFHAMAMSEGSERERYQKIYTELIIGNVNCSDE